MTRITDVLIVTFVLIFAAGCNKQTTSVTNAAQQPTQAGASGTLRSKIPDGWISEQPTSRMRVEQYKLPRADGDTEDASLVLYYFGQGQGGSVDANIERWLSQIQQPDGSSSRGKAKTEKLTVNGLNVTTVDVVGRYTAEMTPGSGTFNDKPDYRLMGAIAETPRGAYFAKLVGPSKTIAKWEASFAEYIKSFEFK